MAASQRLQALGTLAAAVAHEFNNVLEPIILFTDAAIRSLPADSLARADLEFVLASARRGKIVARGILALSETRHAAALLPTDLRSVVSESVALYTALAPHGIEIRSEIPAHIPLVRADAALAVNLLLNLCSNGLLAMPGNQGVLTVGLRSAPPEVELWVADTGEGMRQEVRERLFEPFFTTRPPGKGAGLGLFVVHEIAKSFGARLVVDTRMGAGTTMRIFFAAISEAA
jgi:two-component system, cell cycle sensor histidine kinase and response regulator CckA